MYGKQITTKITAGPKFMETEKKVIPHFLGKSNTPLQNHCREELEFQNHKKDIGNQIGSRHPRLCNELLSNFLWYEWDHC